MTNLCFLLDEHVAHAIARGLRELDPTIQVFTMGGANAPSIGTDDSDLLIWIEEQGCLLITNNRKTMPRHLQEHLAAGHHVPGIVVVRRLSWGEIINQLYLLWAASLPGEFRDQIVYLPLVR